MMDRKKNVNEGKNVKKKTGKEKPIEITDLNDIDENWNENISKKYTAYDMQKSLNEQKTAMTDRIFSAAEDMYIGHQNTPADTVMALTRGTSVSNPYRPNRRTRIQEISVSSDDDTMGLASSSATQQVSMEKMAKTKFDFAGRAAFLDTLTTEFRRPNAIDYWGPLEVAIFEAAICYYGKDFQQIKKHLPRKTQEEVVEFYYYVWKRCSRYKVWKGERDNIARYWESRD